MATPEKKRSAASFITRPNFIILGLVSLFVVVEILFLRPSSLERSEEETQSMFGSIETMVEAEKQKEEVGYTIDGFHYTAVQGEIRNWEIRANEAMLYEKSKLVHALTAKIHMFDSSGKITFIQGDEAYFQMGSRDVDLKGNVKVIFPDGFSVETTRAHYAAVQDLISSDSDFTGVSSTKGEDLQVWGTGFRAFKSGPDINVLKNSRVKIKRPGQALTEVYSDKSNIDRISKIAKFNMTATSRRVKSRQGTLDIEARQQEAIFDADAKRVKYLTATEDVIIRETDEQRSKEGLKYATCQKADFYTEEDKILLTGFPSAYQGNDILTGELITVYRADNLVEVTQANAFHHGNK